MDTLETLKAFGNAKNFCDIDLLELFKGLKAGLDKVADTISQSAYDKTRRADD